MIYLIIKEWVAMMPAETIEMVINSLPDDKLRHLHLKALRENISSGYRPDLVNIYKDVNK